MSEIVARLIELSPAEGNPERGHDLTLGAHVLGRGAGVDVMLDHADVSRRHAELLITHEGATIRDLGSKNGFVVDGRVYLRKTSETYMALLQRSGEPASRLRSP